MERAPRTSMRMSLFSNLDAVSGAERLLEQVDMARGLVEVEMRVYGLGGLRKRNQIARP
jgi:hypothetical protein